MEIVNTVSIFWPERNAMDYIFYPRPEASSKARALGRLKRELYSTRDICRGYNRVNNTSTERKRNETVEQSEER